MFSKKIEEKASKFVSFILRHSPEDIGLTLDENGWVSVDEFIDKANKSEKKFFVLDLELLKQVVKNSDKQRFAFSEDGTKIRANQGHTVEVNLDLPFVEPPEFLYHGTADKSVDIIFKEGLKPMKRHDVHLSFSIKIARSVGMRYGVPVILKIKAKQMFDDGYQFQCSKNNVWLTKEVPIKYIEITHEKE